MAANAMRNRVRLEMIRVGGAVAIPEVLHDLGADADTIIGAAGLRREIFADPDNVIPSVALGRLLFDCVAATRCEHFGLLVGQRGLAPSLGLVGLLAQNSTDVRAALDNLIRYFHIHGHCGVPFLEVTNGTTCLGYTIFENFIPGAQQIVDGAVAIAFRMVRSLCGESWRPDEVLLPRSKPKDPKPFYVFFGAPVRFGAEYGGLIFSTEWLARRVTSANPLIRKLVEDRISEIDVSFGEQFGAQLRHLVRTLVLSHRCSLEAVAHLFNIEARTLSRRLEREKIKFRTVVNEVRYEIAQRLLADTLLPMTHVAAVLDYSEPSAFTRAFRRWSGIAPAEWRMGSATHRPRQ